MHKIAESIPQFKNCSLLHVYSRAVVAPNWASTNKNLI